MRTEQPQNNREISFDEKMHDKVPFIYK